MKHKIGAKFGRLELIARAGRSTWLMRCACGTEKTYQQAGVTMGRVVSCGCFNREKSTKHGMEGTKLYNVWASMLQRCRNPNHRAYALYGGRGIKVCKRWYDFRNFYADMGEPGTDAENGRRLMIDRIDNDKGYTPENCRWVTYSVSNRNQRRHASGLDRK